MAPVVARLYLDVMKSISSIGVPLSKQTPEQFITNIFKAKAVQRGGVLKRAISLVLKYSGEAMLFSEVTRRGFRLYRTQTHYLVICSSDGTIEPVR